MMHSSTTDASMRARRTASATARAPRSVADSDFSAPRNLPVGVRTAETMTVSRTLTHRNGRHGFRAEELLQAAEDDRRRAPYFVRPLLAGRVDDQRAVLEPHAGFALDRGTNGRPPRERHFA